MKTAPRSSGCVGQLDTERAFRERVDRHVLPLTAGIAVAASHSISISMLGWRSMGSLRCWRSGGYADVVRSARPFSAAALLATTPDDSEVLA